MIPQTPDIMKSPLCYEGDKRNIPADTPLGTNQLSYKQGFPPITSIDVDAGGIAPDRLDFNAALNLLSTFIYYMQSGNQFAWNNQLDYNTGAFVLGSDNAVYFCIKANGATEPNTVQDPISSTGYWIQILSSDGKLNAGALSVTLGSFAQLNSLALTDNKLTDILPPNKGGTGRSDGASLSVRYNTNTTVDTWKEYHNGVNFMFWQNGDWQEKGLPGIAGHMMCTDFTNSLKSRLVLLSISSRLYGYDFSKNKWNRYLNDSDIIPTSSISGLATVATSGSYNDLTNKPTIPTNVAPLPIPYAPSNLVGTWTSVQVGTKYTLPAGGSWAWFGINIANNRLVASIAAGGTDIKLVEGDINNRFLIWRIQ